MSKSIKFIFIWLILSFVIIFSGGIAAAESSVPMLPCEFSGMVTIEEQPALAGTIIRAFIGEKEAGRFVVTKTGIYGGEGLFDDRLVVEGCEDAVNKEITFKIWSNDAATTETYTPGNSRKLDLSIAELEGDLNTNAFVDIGDVSKVAYMVAGKTEKDIKADFNGNGDVDVGDASKIAYFFVRKVEFL